MDAKRFRPGKAYGGALAVLDHERDSRAVCIVLPDPVKPDAAPRVAQIIADTLNTINDRRTGA